MSKLVLIVEDNRDNSAIIEKILMHYSYEVKVMSDGEEVLRYCKTNSPPALILMDISLPGMDGFEITKLIRKIRHYDLVPIVAISAYSNKETEEKALAVGCVNMIAKPFTPNELVRILERYVISKE